MAHADYMMIKYFPIVSLSAEWLSKVNRVDFKRKVSLSDYLALSVTRQQQLSALQHVQSIYSAVCSRLTALLTSDSRNS